MLAYSVIRHINPKVIYFHMHAYNIWAWFHLLADFVVKNSGTALTGKDMNAHILMSSPMNVEFVARHSTLKNV